MHPILKRVTFMRFSAHNVFVEDFMVKDVKFLTTHSSYKDAKQLLESFMFRSFPLIESQGGMQATCHLILTFVLRLSVQFIGRVAYLAGIGAAGWAHSSPWRNAQSVQTQRVLQGHGSALLQHGSIAGSHDHTTNTKSCRWFWSSLSKSKNCFMLLVLP